jgi:hypothetical protein
MMDRELEELIAGVLSLVTARQWQDLHPNDSNSGLTVELYTEVVETNARIYVDSMAD